MVRLRFLRIERGLSQSDLAPLVQIPRASICYIERGRVLPTIEELDRLGKFFGVPGSRLLEHISDNLLPDGAAANDSARERQ